MINYIDRNRTVLLFDTAQTRNHGVGDKKDPRQKHGLFPCRRGDHPCKGQSR